MGFTAFKSLELNAARAASRQPEFEAIVNQKAAALRSAAARTNKTGAFLSSIKVEVSPTPGGVRDRVISSDDPNVLSIEYGHMTKNGKWVPGKGIFTALAEGAL